MSPSVSDLKNRLREFLSSPQANKEFRTWFLSQLRSVHKANDPELESLVHAVQRMLSDAAQGDCNAEELRDALAFVVDCPELFPATASVAFIETEVPGAYIAFQQSSFSASGSYASDRDHATSSWRTAAAPCSAA